MLNQPAPGQTDLIRSTAHTSPAGAEVTRMFQRTLAAWVLDCARLRRRGLDRPRHRPAVRHRSPEPTGPARWAQFRGA